MEYIHLPFGVRYNNENKISLNLLSNYKSEVLFFQLLDLAHLNQPIFKEKLDKLLNAEKGIQKFLLSTSDIRRKYQQDVYSILKM